MRPMLDEALSREEDRRLFYPPDETKRQQERARATTLLVSLLAPESAVEPWTLERCPRIRRVLFDL
jgi:hypothetical protein